MHDARARARRAGPDPDERALRAATRRAARPRSPPIGRPAVARSPIVATLGTTSSTSVDPVAAIADIAEREGLWLHVDAAYAGVVAMLPDRRAPFEGWERADLDRREPAQVAVHAAGRLAAADPADGRARARRSASSRSTCARSTARRRSTTTTSTRRSSAGASARSSCGSSCAGSGSRGCARRIRAAPRAGRVVRGAGRRRPGLGAARARPVLDRLLPLATGAAGPARTRPSTTRNAAIMDAVNRTGEVFLSHTRLAGRFTIRVAIGNLRTEQRHVERAWALLREAAAVAARHEARAARRPVLRDARRAARLVRCEPRDRRRALARRLQEGDRPAERRLVAGGRRGAVRRLDRQRPATASTRTRTPSGSRRGARGATGARSTSRRSRR